MSSTIVPTVVENNTNNVHKKHISDRGIIRVGSRKSEVYGFFLFFSSTLK